MRTNSSLYASARWTGFVVPLVGILFSALQTQPAAAYPAKKYVSHSRHASHVRHVSHARYASRVRLASAPRAGCLFSDDARYFCGSSSVSSPVMTRVSARAMSRRATAMGTAGVVMYRVVDEGTIIGGRPADCPHAYCGCGLRKHL